MNKEEVRILGIIQGLKEDDLVLIPHYFSGEKIAGRMILAMVDKEATRQDCDFTFLVKSLVVLHKKEYQKNNYYLPPFITERYDGCWHFFDVGNFGNEARFRIHVNTCLSRCQIYIGKDKVFKVLRSTFGYSSHLAVLDNIFSCAEALKSVEFFH